DFLRVITTGEGAFGERPIAFRLAESFLRRFTLRPRVKGLTRGILAVDVKFEIAQMMGLVRMLLRFNVEICVIFLVGEAWQAKYASVVSGCWVSPEFARERTQQ